MARRGSKRRRKSEEPQRRRESPKESEDVPTKLTGSRKRFQHPSKWDFYPGLKMECRAALGN